MTATFTNLEAVKKHFNTAEIDQIRAKAEEMLAGDTVEVYFSLGAHDVCLERDSNTDKSVRIARMLIPLRHNEANVHGANNRRKREAI